MKPNFGRRARCVQMFDVVPSGGEPSVRTHVPLRGTRSPRRPHGWPACTRRGAPGALVPAARARPRGRLGGRLGSERGVRAAAGGTSGAIARSLAAGPSAGGRTRLSPSRRSPAGSARAGAAAMRGGYGGHEPSRDAGTAPLRSPSVRHPTVPTGGGRQPQWPSRSRPRAMSAGVPVPAEPRGYQPPARAGRRPRGPPSTGNRVPLSGDRVRSPAIAFDGETGGVLLSQALSSQVPSALRGLTSLFGMGRGVSPSLKPPEKGETSLPGPSKLHSATRASGIKKSVKPSTH